MILGNLFVTVDSAVTVVTTDDELIDELILSWDKLVKVVFAATIWNIICTVIIWQVKARVI